MFVIHMLCFDSQQLMATYTFTLMMNPISPSLQLMPKAILITLYNYECPRCYVITKVHVSFQDIEFIHHWSPPATFEARICRCIFLNRFLPTASELMYHRIPQWTTDKPVRLRVAQTTNKCFGVLAWYLLLFSVVSHFICCGSGYSYPGRCVKWFFNGLGLIKPGP